MPSYGEPCMFVLSPIYKNGSKIAVIALKISNAQLTNIVTNGFNFKEDGLGSAGDVFIVGHDGYLRTDRRQLKENKEAYVKGLRQHNMVDDQDAETINLLNTGVLLVPVKLESAEKALNGEFSNSIEPDKLGTKVMTCAAPLRLRDKKWAVVSQMNEREVFGILDSFRRINLFLTVFILGFFIWIGRVVAQSVSNRLFNMHKSLGLLANGRVNDFVADQGNDEIAQAGALVNKLVTRMSKAAEFAMNIGQGKTDTKYEVVDENDRFGSAMNEMRDQLENARLEQEQRALEDKKRNWASQGIAKFSELLRLNNDNIHKLAYQIVSELVAYINANQAGIFVTNDDSNEDKDDLSLIAAYAYDREKYLTRTVKPGEGLVGTCALEGKTIFMTELPEDYINITSGLGDSTPTSLLLVPMIADSKVLGVIEIASFNKFEKHEIEFMENIARNIGSTLRRCA
ncbi:MAG: GAF domain-containing protein [Bacteroidales bacterium]|nr:GAF domain-containing protein [Bacteroidales bacterium]